MVQHVGRARKRIRHHLTWEIRNKMLGECLNCFKLPSNIFWEKNVDPTSSNMARKRTQHFWSSVLNEVGPTCWTYFERTLKEVENIIFWNVTYLIIILLYLWIQWLKYTRMFCDTISKVRKTTIKAIKNGCTY